MVYVAGPLPISFGRGSTFLLNHFLELSAKS